MSTTNYFVVPGYRIVPPVADSPPEEAATDEFATRRKIDRIANRKPLPVDWARYFFFDDEDPTSILRAYDAARRVSASVAVFRAPAAQGPWGATRVIGTFEESAN